MLRRDEILSSLRGSEPASQPFSGPNGELGREVQSGPEAQIVDLFQHISVCGALLDYFGRVIFKDVDRVILVLQLAPQPSSLAHNQLLDLKSVEPQHDSPRLSAGPGRALVSELACDGLIPALNLVYVSQEPQLEVEKKKLSAEHLQCSRGGRLFLC